MTWPIADYTRARAMLERRWPDIADDIDACAVLDTARACWYPDMGAKWGAWWRWHVHGAALRHMARERTRLRALDRLAAEPAPEPGPSPERLVDALRYWRRVPTLWPQQAIVVWHRAHGATLHEIGHEIGRSRERARQVWRDALRRLHPDAEPHETA